MDQIYARQWRPDGATPAHVLVVHGFAEHVGRYHRVASRMAQQGLCVHGYDQRGHGRSPGRRG